MKGIEAILENNRQWVDKQRAADPDFFSRLAKGQQPK
jgi:carbonic anhydrase